MVRVVLLTTNQQLSSKPSGYEGYKSDNDELCVKRHQGRIVVQDEFLAKILNRMNQFYSVSLGHLFSQEDSPHTHVRAQLAHLKGDSWRYTLKSLSNSSGFDDSC